MKIPQIKPCSLEKFQKLPKTEQLKHKVSGLIRENCGKEYNIWTEPKNEYQAFGNLWTRIFNIIKSSRKIK